MSRYESAYLFGAICPARGNGAAHAMPRADTEAMQAHLDEIAHTVAKRAHAVLLLDRAGWHTTDNLVVPKNMTLIFLPPRSPERNPVEIWQYLRANWLSNRVFETYDDTIDAAWNKLIAQTQQLGPRPGGHPVQAAFSPTPWVDSVTILAGCHNEGAVLLGAVLGLKRDPASIRVDRMDGNGGSCPVTLTVSRF